jgi:LysR family transcriptional regulator, nod-box dependent transcriptional activator
MRFGHFDMNLLVALDALLDTSSVTRASARLNIGQSATSSALSRLREHFGDELLIQVGRRMELTQLARSLVQPVRETLLKVQATVATRSEFDPSVEKRRFLIQASDYATTVLLVDVLQRLHREAPGVSLHIANMSDDVEQRLRRGEVDLVIFPDAYAIPDHPRELLFEEHFVCVVWSDNPLVGETLSFDQYIKLGHVGSAFGDTRLDSFESWFFKNYGAQRCVEVTTTNFNTLPQLVVGTTRIATIHVRLANFYARYLPLHLL